MDTAATTAAPCGAVEDPPSDELDDWLCLALYNASRAMTSRYRTLLAELGLTYPQYLVLSVLWAEGDVTVGRIGERLRLDSGTVSPLLRRLEQADLVHRSRSTRDERLTIVGLTPRSEAMRAEAALVPAAVCEAAGLSATDREQLVGQLRTLVLTLDG